MRWRNFFRKAAVTAAAASFLLFSAIALVGRQLPAEFQTVAGRAFSLSGPGLSASRLPGDEIPASSALEEGGYRAQVKLLGLIPVKTVAVREVAETEVIPCGTPFGIQMYTNGVMIVGISEIQSGGEIVNPAKEAGLQPGDIILQINGVKMEQNEQVAQTIEGSGGAPVQVTVRRGETLHETTLCPVLSDVDALWKGGLWVRDSTAGIGTVTFYQPEDGKFGGLGHGVCDVDTAGLMPLRNGKLVPVAINGIVKGERGRAGELRGYFSSDTPVGDLLANLETGVYGVLWSCPVQQEAVPVAMKQEVVSGPAQILATLDENGPQLYDIRIESVNYDETAKTKNLVLSVTDPVLLEKTGGIVQGMSGSPILQNGRLAGAVTHVFVNDPTHGYGIFAENMLAAAQSLSSAIDRSPAA